MGLCWRFVGWIVIDEGDENGDKYVYEGVVVVVVVK